MDDRKYEADLVKKLRKLLDSAQDESDSKEKYRHIFLARMIVAELDHLYESDEDEDEDEN